MSAFESNNVYILAVSVKHITDTWTPPIDTVKINSLHILFSADSEERTYYPRTMSLSNIMRDIHVVTRRKLTEQDTPVDYGIEYRYWTENLKSARVLHSAVEMVLLDEMLRLPHSDAEDWRLWWTLRRKTLFLSLAEMSITSDIW